MSSLSIGLDLWAFRRAVCFATHRSMHCMAHRKKDSGFKIPVTCIRVGILQHYGVFARCAAHSLLYRASSRIGCGKLQLPDPAPWLALGQCCMSAIKGPLHAFPQKAPHLGPRTLPRAAC